MKLNVADIQESEKPEIVKQIRTEHRLIESIPNPKKLPLWELDKEFNLKRVIFISATLVPEERLKNGGIIPAYTKLRAEYKNGSAYLLAINEKNAARKFVNLIKLWKKTYQK